MQNEYLTCELHCHTNHSSCSTLTLKKIIKQCERKGIDVIAITDHNEIKGALELKKIAPKWLTVIIGEEIQTLHGEIIGLFLSEKIESGLSLKETIEKIKSQGALVCIPHPFDYVRKNTIMQTELENCIDQVDMIEIFNSRVTYKKSNRIALEYAVKKNILPVCGSDSHTGLEIGKSILRIHPFNNAETFKENLNKAILCSQKSPAFVHLISKIAKMRKSLLFSFIFTFA